MDVIAAYLRIRSISSFPYLDDWLVKNLLRQKLISQTIFRHRSIQILGFIPNLDKSDLIPSQKFTFIGIEFLTHQNIVRVPPHGRELVLLTINQFLSQTYVQARISFLSWANSVLRQIQWFQVVFIWDHFKCAFSQCGPHLLPLDHPIPITNLIRYHLNWWTDPKHLIQGTCTHPPDPTSFLFTRRQSFWIGCSSGTDGSMLSQSLDRRPIPTPHQYSRDYCHSVCSEKGHTFHTTFLCHDID